MEGSSDTVVSSVYAAATTSLNTTAETLTLTFPEELPEGETTLSICYTGTINNQMRGFYRSQCSSPRSGHNYVGVTQFEPVDAHRALPCWDEPALKATFDVSLVIPKDLVGLSNMVTTMMQ